MYSFHINDAFQFSRHVRVVEEQMPLGLTTEQVRNLQRSYRASSEGADPARPYWESVAFWYALPAQPSGSF